MFMPPTDPLIVVITNYDFSLEATRLKIGFAPHAPTVLIDGSSPTRPTDADLVIPNAGYSGLWEAAVQRAIEAEAEWLLFIASDVRVDDHRQLIAFAREAMADDRIGVYTPSVEPTSRCAYQACFNRLTATVRETAVVEGFCFLARVSLLRSMSPVQVKNPHGWLLDALLTVRARQQGMVAARGRRPHSISDVERPLKTPFRPSLFRASIFGPSHRPACGNSDPLISSPMPLLIQTAHSTPSRRSIGSSTSRV